MSFVRPEGYTYEQALTSVGPGWVRLLARVFKALPEGTRIVQVKEKWGGLRIYADNAPGTFAQVLWTVEAESFSLCEFCGAPGRLRSDRPWHKTLCGIHATG